MSERYVPPPPPYELSIQRDQKLTEEVQTLKVSKGNPFRDDEWNDSKHSSLLALKDIAVHTIPSGPRYQTRSDSASLRARRPLPSRPVDTHPLGLQGQGDKLWSDAEIKPYAMQNDHAMELRSAASLLFPATAPSPDQSPYLQSMHHQSTSVQRSPLHYPSQSLYDTPRQERDDRWLVSARSSTELRAEASFRRSPHMPLQSPSYSLPHNNNAGTRLAFDPSVAYSDSQGNARTTFSTRQGAAASFYR